MYKSNPDYEALASVEKESTIYLDAVVTKIIFDEIHLKTLRVSNVSVDAQSDEIPQPGPQNDAVRPQPGASINQCFWFWAKYIYIYI